jgi:hypothetical protein
VPPSPEEIKKGKDAFRRIGNYDKSKQRIRKLAVSTGIFGVLFILSLHSMGAGWTEVILCGGLWLCPELVMRLCLKWQLNHDLTTLRLLREKYGAAIDSDMRIPSS